MKQIIRFTAVAVLFLFLGLGTSNGQEVTYSIGPAVIPPTGAANGGFAWGDLTGNGYLSVWIPSNSVLLNNSGSSFSVAASTMTANIILQTNSVGGVLADFNGDGVVDLFSTNNATPASGLFYNTNGVFTAATGTGDLATAGITGTVFVGAAVAPIDHSNYLSLAWPGTFTNIAGGVGPYPGGGGIWLLKGGAAGFTKIGRGAIPANRGIDTSLSFESWDVRFFDANNDGYQDLLMPSFRNGFSRVGSGASGARKGCVLFLNDGTGKFIVPTSATIPGNPTLYAPDSIIVNKAGTVDSITYVSVRADTGIIVDDTVYHFAAIGEQWGDLNNDGKMDLVLNGLNANDNKDGNDSLKADIILYGNGDGTFTYKWDGVNVVASNGLKQATGQRSISIGDYNNDGLPDILTSETFTPQHLYKNNGNGTFSDMATTDGLTGGPGTQRAAQFVDYNKDGFPDVFIYTGGSAVLQKNGGNSNNWIGITPVGAGHNMSAIGARFTVISGATMQIRDISASAGSAGQGGNLWANFGLGAGNVDTVKVRWPDGTTQTWSWTKLAAGGTQASVAKKYWKIVQGSDVPLAPVQARPSWIAKNDTSLLSKDTLSWNKVTGGTSAVTYQAQVATIRTFATVLKDVTNLTDSSTIVNLGLSTTYYWRVRAFSAGFTGAWSAVDSFKTLYTPCTTTPTPLSPLADSKTESIKPTLKMNYVFTASTYHIEVDTLNRYAIRDTAHSNGVVDTTNPGHFGALVLNDSTTIFDTTYTFATALKPTYRYYWRVRGWNSAGSSGWSAVDSFTVIFVPATPVLAYPAHNQANVSAINLKLKWNSVKGDSNYVVQSWTYTINGVYTRNDTTKHDTTFTLASLLNRQKYYWKVRAFNQGGASAFTAPDSFSTVIEVPAQVTLDGPRNLTGVNRKTMFTWLPALNATSYHLQVATSSPFAAADIKVDVMSTDTSELISDTLLASTVYYWRVCGVNLGGEGAFSSVAHYTTGTTVNVDNAVSQIPKEFALMQNYPNPFNPTTTITYDIPKSAFVSLKVYDVLGRLVTTLVDGIQEANSYRLQWNPTGLSSGVYFYRIQARSQDGSKNFTSVKKLVFMK